MGKISNLSPEKVAEVCSEYSNGDTLKEIGKRLDLSPPTVAKLLKNNGVKLRGRGKKGPSLPYRSQQLLFPQLDKTSEVVREEKENISKQIEEFIEASS